MSQAQIQDIIIIGLGAMGSAAFYHASKAGKKILGIEQYPLLHNYGSYHGETRIIRQAYMEGEFYVKMAQRSAQLWRELENESGQKLYETNGCLMVGPKDSKVIQATKETADFHNLKYSEYNSADLKKRVPGWTLPEGCVAVYDESAGLVYSERCIEAHIQQGLKINSKSSAMFETKVKSYRNLNQELIEVQTDKGSFVTKQLIISAGLWVNEVLSDFKLPLVIQKNSVAWFENNDEEYQIGNMPCFLVEYDTGKYTYGFPNALGTGVKIGLHQQGPVYQQASQRDYQKDDSQYELIREKMKPFLPKVVEGQIVKKAVCFYTLAPDDHFIIDFHPVNSNIVILSPCSGHGFKFSAVIGEIANELLRTKKNPYSHFKIERFNPKQKL